MPLVHIMPLTDVDLRGYRKYSRECENVERVFLIYTRVGLVDDWPIVNSVSFDVVKADRLALRLERPADARIGRNVKRIPSIYLRRNTHGMIPHI